MTDSRLLSVISCVTCYVWMSEWEKRDITYVWTHPCFCFTPYTYHHPSPASFTIELTCHQHQLCGFSLPKERLYANTKVGERFSYMDGKKSPAEFPDTPSLSCEHLPAKRGVTSLFRMELTHHFCYSTNTHNQPTNIWLQIELHVQSFALRFNRELL